MSEIPQINPCEPSQVDTLTATLADSFSNDPVLNWVIPRKDVYEDFFALLYREVFEPRGISHLESQGRGASLWLQQAAESVLKDPTAMSLATIDGEGRPWQRIVLLKGVSTRGFVFYTNQESAKAQAIAGEPRVSLLFP